MGIFNTSYMTEDINVEPLYVEENENDGVLDCNFSEMAILGSVEVTEAHKALVESIAAQEISAMEEGLEVVYEASSVSSIGEKIKSLIKKAIEKIKSLFEKAIAVFRSWVQSDKDFIKKYQTTFTKNWLKLKKLDMKVYKYNKDIRAVYGGGASDGETESNNEIARTKATEAANKVGKSSVTYGDLISFNFSSSDIKKLEDFRAEMDKIDATDAADALRGVLFGVVGKDGDTASRTAKEFREDLYEFYREGEESKDSMDKHELESNGYSSTDIISRLTNGEKSTSNLDKRFRKLNKVLEKEINDTNKIIGKTKYDGTDNENKLATLKTWCLVKYTAALSISLECMQIRQGEFIQACKEYSRTCKAIATKVVAMGEKRLAQEESYDFGSDDSYTDSFMNAVVIK